MASLPPLPYDGRNWYWTVAGDTTRAYSSLQGDYLVVNNSTFVQWKSAGGVPTPISSEAALGEILAAYVPNITLTSTVLTIQQALRQAQLDQVLIANADLVKLVQAGQSTTITGPGMSGFLATSTNNYRTLRAQIAAAASPVAVRAIDVNSGWPSNP